MKWRDALETAATIAVAVAWFAVARPVALGGPASYIVVHGYSMSGTLAPGDLVITEAQGEYSAGDAIVYRVPSGAGKGLLVVHRIVRADPAGYTMQGDANSFQDPWRPARSDVVGRLVVTLPGLGRFLSSLANPFVLAAIWGLTALIVGMTFLPRPPPSIPGDPSEPRTAKRQRRGLPDAVAASSQAVVGLMAGLVTRSSAVILKPVRGWTKPTFPNRPRDGCSALRVATGWALSVLIALVVVSACATLSPGHAARLTVHSAVVSARVGASVPAMAIAAPASTPSQGGSGPSASSTRLNPVH